MEKLDRLGWAAGFVFSSYGVRAGIRVNEPRLVAPLLERLPPGWKLARRPVVERIYSLRVGGQGARPGVRRFNLLYVNSERLARTTDLGEALELLESDLKLYVAGEARRRVFIHAGVVGWKGRAILIPGRSFSGKTTLVAELVRAGAAYYSDEYAVLDASGRVHPYPRPLAVRREGPPAFREKLSAEAFGGRDGIKPLPVGMIVVTKYEEGAKWRPRSLSMGQGILALLEHTVSARQQPERALAALGQATLAAQTFKSLRGGAAETAPLILSLLKEKIG